MRAALLLGALACLAAGSAVPVADRAPVAELDEPEALPQGVDPLAYFGSRARRLFDGLSGMGPMEGMTTAGGTAAGLMGSMAGGGGGGGDPEVQRFQEYVATLAPAVFATYLFLGIALCMVVFCCTFACCFCCTLALLPFECLCCSTCLEACCSCLRFCCPCC